MSNTCAKPCDSGYVRADGRCQESGKVTCSAPRVPVGDTCVTCDTQKGFVYDGANGGRCVCDPRRFAGQADDGSCVPRQIPEDKCPSRIFDYDDPTVCMEFCPVSMQLEQYDDYSLCRTCEVAFYDPKFGKTTCTTKLQCMLRYDRVVKRVYENGRAVTLCVERNARDVLEIAGEIMEGASAAAVVSDGTDKYYFVQKGSDVKWSTRGFKDAANGGQYLCV